MRTSSLAIRFALIAVGDHGAAEALLATNPALATSGLARSDEHFLTARRAQVYEGDTALHAPAFSYDAEFARRLLAVGADVGAWNRRGGEPLHSAMIGGPGSPTWNPAQQREIIVCLIDVGADPNARASGGVTPLHRAVRNRCSGAVEILLALGADQSMRDDSGSTAADLARWTTGRSGSGSDAAKAEQQAIIKLLNGPNR